ncbi:MAG: HEAT repeat domain-containing protein [Sandaracinaceae bacterium]
MKTQSFAVRLVLMGALVALTACHANADDPAGQAGELEDPVRRQNAIENISRLYTQAMTRARDQHEGEDARAIETVTNAEGSEAPGPKAIADATVAQLVTTYTDRSPTPADGLRILEILNEMQDPRGIPAFIEALEWRAEVSEEHAIRAAQALQRIDVPDDQKGNVITALSTNLARVEGSRGDDNRMRIAFIQALGHMEDNRATPALTQVMTRLSEDQSFLINRMAAEQLGALGDPAAVPDLIRSLFLFESNRPNMRMNDVAAQALVTIGRPAHEPLVELLNGGNDAANSIAENYIAAIARIDENAASQMDPVTVRVGESCYALGQLGFPEALDPILAQITPLTEMSVSDAEDADTQVLNRAHGCVIGLVSVNRSQADASRVRTALTDVYARLPKPMRPQLLVAMQHTYDPGLLPFLLEQARAEERELPDLRVLAVRSHAFIANRAEAAQLRTVIAAEPGPEDGGFRTNFEENNPALDTAQECDEDLACYIGKLGDDDAMVVRKAAYMIARYGRGNAEAVNALIEHIDHRDQYVRGDVLYALDWVSTSGSPEAVEAIDTVRRTEEGRSSWNQIKDLAMAIRARLLARAG